MESYIFIHKRVISFCNRSRCGLPTLKLFCPGSVVFHVVNAVGLGDEDATSLCHPMIIIALLRLV